MTGLKTHGRRFDSVQYDPLAQHEEDLQICALDPLKADAVLRQLPKLNLERDVPGIIALLRTVIPDMETARTFSRLEATAALRDLGMFLGSLKKHGVEPVEVLPQLEPVLLHFGHESDLPPRDTVIHYGVWNPDGERQRLYTVHEEEARLVDATKIGAIHVHNAIEHLVALYEIPLVSEDFVPASERVIREVAGLVDAILYVAKHVPRKLFAEEIRFYFDPIRIAGKDYLGPGSVETPTYVIDHILWSGQSTDPEYVQFKRGYIPYAKPWVRELFFRFDGQPPLLRLVAEALSITSSHPYLLASASATLKLIDAMLKFRMPHKKLADEAYTHSATLNPGRTQGSGGYEPSILDHIKDLTLQARNELKEHIQAYVQRTGASADTSALAARQLASNS
ncbi:monodechloroaminopyrrolnitrin synthase PrnB family protein [Hyalangium sp.]|uniref:monodechloroaminopyrrolnitrin synthase PrnB family protein n=1 Tax=Hyalangium sp. TaxID=2028555 RepID=UPI002D3977B4|nr:monodechloroaminopyrrolnitrin synthase PrnB family protein [Hyalangium sp.]HYH94944.1 monodechloroaminopyrrolnitrin synthase PrnB family protein [Hyalangium sp.]